MAAMAYVRQGLVMVVVHGDAPPTAAEWNSYVEHFTSVRALVSRIYVHTEGGGPSSVQRRALAEAMGDSPPRTAVLTDSLVARGIVTAMAWLKGDFIRAFPPHDTYGAMHYLEIEPSQRTDILAFVQANAALLKGTAKRPDASVQP